MPNPFKDWARMYGANKQYLESQGRPSSFLGQIGDIPNRIHEAVDAGEIGMKMMRHSGSWNTSSPSPGKRTSPVPPSAFTLRSLRSVRRSSGWNANWASHFWTDRAGRCG